MLEVMFLHSYCNLSTDMSSKNVLSGMMAISGHVSLAAGTSLSNCFSGNLLPETLCGTFAHALRPTTISYTTWGSGSMLTNQRFPGQMNEGTGGYLPILASI